MSLETLFYSDNMLINILVMMEMYWVYFTALFGPATYYIFLKIFTFPLITRKSHDLVLVAASESVKIKKAVSRSEPCFKYKRGLYWFSESCDDENSLNKYNIYLEGINQPITEMSRNNSKLSDITHTDRISRQVVSHKILFPVRIREHFNRHFRLTVNAETGSVRLEAVKERQPLRVSFYHTMGIFIETRQQVEQEMTLESGSSAGLVQVQLTSQLMLKQLKATSETRNFNAGYAYAAWRDAVNGPTSIVGNLSGSLDPKIVMLLLALMGVGAAVFFMFYYSNPSNVLGPMPQ